MDDKARADEEAGRMNGERLDDAIRLGLEQGRRRTVGIKRKRISVQMGLTAVCMLLLLTAFVRVSPSFAALMKEIPGLSGFVELIEGDQTLVSALNNKFIQPLQVADVQNGFKLTVSGVIADDNRLVILYAGEGPGITKDSEIEDFKLYDDNGEMLQATTVFSHFRDNKEEESGSLMYDYIDVSLADGVKMPEEVHFRVKLKGQWLGVDVPIDHAGFAGMREEIAVNETIEIDGQRFTVISAIITPLQVRVKVKADPANTLQANGFVDVALVDEKKRRYTWKSGTSDMEPDIVYNFQSGYFDKPKKLTLEASGVYLSKRDQKFVIDTETGETIETPDERITFHSLRKEGDGYVMRVDMAHLDEIEEIRGYTFLEHLGEFRDGDGKSFTIRSRDGIMIELEPGVEVRYYYSIPKEAYKQPLTFEVIQYPGYALAPIRIAIK